jgi:hypothetical protein
MKLLLAISSEDPTAQQETKELNIRNPQATIANLRAAVSVTLKIPSGGFRMCVGEEELTDESKRLDAVPLEEGMTVTVIKKRPRDEPNSSAGGAVTAASSSSQPPTRIHRTEAGSRRAADPVASDAIFRQLQAMAQAHQGAGAADFSGGEEDDDEEDSDDDGSLAEDAQFEFGLEGDDDDDEEEDEGDEEDTPEIREQMELVSMLLALPNFETIKSRFDADPRAAMADIQTANPQLFNLIARHTQFFLDFLEAGGHYGTGASSSDDGDSDADDMDPETARAIAESAASAPIQSAPSTAAAAAVPSNGGNAEGRTLTEADTRNIEELMLLGFSREKCTEAYFKHGRNPNRAAGALFDAGP